MQVFNSINARKLKREEKNVFAGIFDNYMYILIQLVIIIGQILMVTFGGRALRTHPLSVEQHLCCLVIAALAIPLSYCVKFIAFEDSEEIDGVEVKSKMSYRNTLRGGSGSERKSIGQVQIKKYKSIS